MRTVGVPGIDLHPISKLVHTFLDKEQLVDSDFGSHCGK